MNTRRISPSSKPDFLQEDVKDFKSTNYDWGNKAGMQDIMLKIRNMYSGMIFWN